MKQLDKLIKGYTKKIQTYLSSFGLEEIQILEEIEERNSSDFDNKLLFGMCGIDDCQAITLISSQDFPTSELPLEVLLIPPKIGNFFVDSENSAIGTDFFYRIEDNKIILVKTDKPIVLDGLSSVFTN